MAYPDGAFLAVLHAGRVLLVQRADQDLWELPGGGVEPGDLNWQFSASRELREETGLTVYPGHVEHVGTYWRPERGNTVRVGLTRTVTGRLQPNPTEVAAVCWIGPGWLPGPVTPIVQARLADVWSYTPGHVRYRTQHHRSRPDLLNSGGRAGDQR